MRVPTVIRRLSSASVHLGWLAAGLLVLGFFLFANHATRTAPQTPEPSDGIVVLTGDGGARVLTGMELLERGLGERLLVTGVNPQVTDEELARLAGGSREVFDCCVDIDRAATDTIGNAIETAHWARRNGFSKVLVVTADYHMPRSLQELRHAMPEVEFASYPVPSARGRGPWWTRASYWRRLPPEYAKYLLASMRLWFSGPVEA